MKYKVIYADPPWRFKNYGYKSAKRGVEKEYPTMSLQAIKELPIADISDEDSILFLWVVFPQLPEGLEVIKSWGLSYYSIGFNWIKLSRKNAHLFWGMGNYTRSNSEICLIGIKGKPKRKSAAVHSVVIDQMGRHSEKPDDIRKRIVMLMWDVSRIELFARKKTPGWDVWGNQVHSNVQFTQPHT